MNLFIITIIFIFVLFFLSNDKKFVDKFENIKVIIIIFIIYLGFNQNYYYLLFFIILYMVLQSNLKQKLEKSNINFETMKSKLVSVVEKFTEEDINENEEEDMNENEEENYEKYNADEFDDIKNKKINENNSKYKSLKEKFKHLEEKIKSIL